MLFLERQPRVREIGAQSCRESTGTRLTQSSPPQTTSGNSTRLARGSHLQGFVEARAGRRGLGDRLLHTEGETEARRGGRPALVTTRGRQSSCPVVLPGCPCLPVWDTRGPGRVRRLVSGCFFGNDFTSEHQHQGIPVHPLLFPNLRGRYCSGATEAEDELRSSYLPCLRPARRARSVAGATSMTIILKMRVAN